MYDVKLFSHQIYFAIFEEIFLLTLFLKFNALNIQFPVGQKENQQKKKHEKENIIRNIQRVDIKTYLLPNFGSWILVAILTE